MSPDLSHYKLFVLLVRHEVPMRTVAFGLLLRSQNVVRLIILGEQAVLEQQGQGHTFLII